MPKTIEERVIGVIATWVNTNDDPGEITGASNLEEDLALDSLDRDAIAIDIEDEFDIVIDGEAEEWKTVSDIVAYVTKNLPAGK